MKEMATRCSGELLKKLVELNDDCTLLKEYRMNHAKNMMFVSLPEDILLWACLFNRSSGYFESARRCGPDLSVTCSFLLSLNGKAIAVKSR